MKCCYLTHLRNSLPRNLRWGTARQRRKYFFKKIVIVKLFHLLDSPPPPHITLLERHHLHLSMRSVPFANCPILNHYCGTASTASLVQAPNLLTTLCCSPADENLRVGPCKISRGKKCKCFPSHTRAHKQVVTSAIDISSTEPKCPYDESGLLLAAFFNRSILVLSLVYSFMNFM